MSEEMTSESETLKVSKPMWEFFAFSKVSIVITISLSSLLSDMIDLYW